MVDVRAIEPNKYNNILAEALKQTGEFHKPEWVNFVKSGVHKERPINDVNFWHHRAASILRQIYIQKVVGVQRLRTRYGGRKNKGVKPARFKKGSGKIIRLILQQAEKAGLVEKPKSGAGRQLTKEGKNFLEGLKI